MNQNVALVSLLVHDYDEAIRYFVEILSFVLVEDTDLGGGKRWVIVRPSNFNSKTGNAEKVNSCGLLLAKASTPEQIKCIGNQTGGRVFMFLHTDDFWRDHRLMIERGVQFIEEPREEEYGTVVVFNDLYGNKWDFIERKS